MLTPKQRLQLSVMILDETCSLLSKECSSRLAGEFDYLRDCVENFDAADLEAEKFSTETFSCVLMACSSYFADVVNDDKFPSPPVSFFPKETIVNVLLEATNGNFSNGVMGMNINAFLKKIGWDIEGDSSSSE